MRPGAPYGRDPRTGRPYSDKSKVLAGLLQLFLPFGIGPLLLRPHRDRRSPSCWSLFFGGIGVIWAFIDGIVLLAGNPYDPDGRPMRP